MHFLEAALRQTLTLLDLGMPLAVVPPREALPVHLTLMRSRGGPLMGRAGGAAAAAAAARVPKGLQGGAAAGAAAAAAATMRPRTSTRPRWPTTTARTARCGRRAARWARV